jgi:hypothetical protein
MISSCGKGKDLRTPAGFRRSNSISPPGLKCRIHLNKIAGPEMALEVGATIPSGNIKHLLRRGDWLRRRR